MDFKALIDRVMNDAIPDTASVPVRDPPFSCPLCRDTGWIETEHDGYHFSAVCECVKQRSILQRIERSGLGPIMERCTFQSFVHTEPHQQQLWNAVTSYGKALFVDHDAPPPWLYVSGTPGCGKTHICTALCAKAMQSYGMTVRYMQWVEDSRRMKSHIMEPEFDDELDAFTACDLLYIDDLFKNVNNRPPTDADIRLAYLIIDSRYRTDKPTVISSEYSLDDLICTTDEATFSRVWDRAKHFCVHIPRGENNNYRLKGGNENDHSGDLRPLGNGNDHPAEQNAEQCS